MELFLPWSLRIRFFFMLKYSKHVGYRDYLGKWIVLYREVSYMHLKMLEVSWLKVILTAQKLTFFIKSFFSKFDQIRSFLWIWSHLLKKSLMENFIFCAVPFLFLSNSDLIESTEKCLTIKLNTHAYSWVSFEGHVNWLL